MIVTRDQLIEQLDYSTNSGEFVWKRNGKRAGCRRKDGYVMIRVNGVLYYAHRLAWIFATGNQPEFTIDHINGNKSDNRICNLRDINIAINCQNQVKPRSNNISGFLGVQKNHKYGWQAKLQLNGNNYCFGTYKTAEEAHDAYVKGKRKLHEGCTI